MRSRTTTSALAAAALLAAALDPAQAADVDRGQAIAERWCASCHLVSPGQETAIDGVPSFREVAARGELGGDALEAFLASPHPVMPDMALTRMEIEDLAAYVDSLGD